MAQAADACGWSLPLWLSSLPLGELLAAALRRGDSSARQHAGDDLDFVLSSFNTAMTDDDEAGGIAALTRLLQDGDALRGLAEALWAAARRLARDHVHARELCGATRDPARMALDEPAWLSTKFVVEAGDAAPLPMNVGTLELGAQRVAAGGLHALIGSPTAVVIRQSDALTELREEHCARADSEVVFTSSPYSISTSPLLEYWFVSDPTRYDAEASRAHAFPREAPTAGQPASALQGAVRPREAKPPSAFEEKRREVSERLAQLEPPAAPIEAVELLAGRLWTGPMSEVYAGMMRACARDLLSGGHGVGHGVGQAAASDGAMASSASQGGACGYCTTLHALNSLVLKTSRLAPLAPVYRSVAHGALDMAWLGGVDGEGASVDGGWPSSGAGALGAGSTMRGVLEPAFLSATCERADAHRHAMTMGIARPVDGAAPAEGASLGSGVVMTILPRLGARGASLAWLSQYPHESEILFPPMTSLEMTQAGICDGTRSVTVYPTVHVPPHGTLDAVLCARKRLLEAQAAHFADEVAGALHGTIWAPMGHAWRCGQREDRPRPASPRHASLPH